MNNDCVVRTSFYKYFHPKEALISNGILSQEVVRVGNSQPKEEKKKKPDSAFLSNFVGVRDEDGLKEDENGGLTYVYSFGSTLNV